MARVTQKDFDKIRKNCRSIIDDGIKDHNNYVDNTKNLKEDTSEVFIRFTLENLIGNIQQQLVDMYDLFPTGFDNFPPLDQLIYHEGGWTLSIGIENAYKLYKKTGNKELLKSQINSIIENEGNRLVYTIFDTGNEQTQRFHYVEIGGENNCGNCGIHYGVFIASSNAYLLPPFHPACGCWAIYYD